MRCCPRLPRGHRPSYREARIYFYTTESRSAFAIIASLCLRAATFSGIWVARSVRSFASFERSKSSTFPACVFRPAATISFQSPSRTALWLGVVQYNVRAGGVATAPLIAGHMFMPSHLRSFSTVRCDPLHRLVRNQSVTCSSSVIRFPLWCQVSTVSPCL